MDKNIKNVVFDLGGVLLNLDLQRTIDAFKEAGFEDVEKQIRAFNHQGIFQQFQNQFHDIYNGSATYHSKFVLWE